MTIVQSISSFVHDESGQDLIEYALAASLISLAGIASIRSLAGVIVTTFGNINTNFAAAV